MSPLPKGPSPDEEVEQLELASQEATKRERAEVPDGLVPANLLPSAAEAWAQLFPPEAAVGLSAATLACSTVPTEAESYIEGDEANGSQVDFVLITEKTESHVDGQANSGIAEVSIEAEPALQSSVRFKTPAERNPSVESRCAERQVPEAESNGEPAEIGPPQAGYEGEKGRRGRGGALFAWMAIGIRNFLVVGRSVKRKFSRKDSSIPHETSFDPKGLGNEETLVIACAATEVTETTRETTGVFEQTPDSPTMGAKNIQSPESGTLQEGVNQEEISPSAIMPAQSQGDDSDTQSFALEAQEPSQSPKEQSSVDEAPRAETQPQDDARTQGDDAKESFFAEGPAPQSSGGVQNQSAHDHEDDVEIVDLVEEDHAIASVIDRYANRTNPIQAEVPAGASQAQDNVHTQGSSGKQMDINAVLEIPRDPEPSEERGVPHPAAHVPLPNQADLPAPAVAVAAVTAEQFAAEIPPLANVPAHELPESSSGPHLTGVPYRDWSFEEKLASHHEWMESEGTIGKKADLTGADLEGSDLIGVDLRFVDLHDANLRAADLLMSDLRDACLVRANFRDSCLVGANLEAANLEGATLDTAMGLVPRQLAGANLHEASLPQSILEFEALGEFKRASGKVRGFFVAMMSMSALSALLIWITKDFQLLTNSAVLFFLHSPAAAAALPTVQLYLAAPVALFILYLVFQFHLQHLWDLVLELPAVFPDGRTLGENESRIVVGLLRAHFRWMNADAPSTRFVEKAMSSFLAYWIVPMTLLLYWMRFLTLQEPRGTVLQELLVVAAAGVALYSTTRVGRPAERWTVQENFAERAMGRLQQINPVRTALVLLGVLTFLAAGTMMGVPHSKERAPQFMAGSIRRWATAVLWSFGIDPYADLTEAVISTKPANWSGADDQVPAVKGARLNDANFRYAQAYRAFLANAHLLHANFQGAFLSQADLRNSDMGQSNLKYAILDQAQMNHVNLDRAVLDGANLSRADLRAANLSYASLANASLVDTRLEGATLYGAKLASATLIRTNFEKTDLRESHLEGANLEHADMQGAYLWSAKLMGARLTNAQLGTAIFVDADLRNADLRWAHLVGTVLTGADLTGANLDGADFRGAVGFGTNQICSAKSRHGLLLDDAMQSQVTAQCGAGN